MNINYLNYLYPTAIKEIKDTKGNKTGSGFVENDEFLIKDYLKDAYLKIRNNVKRYVDLKKNLPKINESTPRITSNQTRAAFNNARRGFAYYPISLGFVSSDLASSSNF